MIGKGAIMNPYDHRAHVSFYWQELSLESSPPFTTIPSLGRDLKGGYVTSAFDGLDLVATLISSYCHDPSPFESDMSCDPQKIYQEPPPSKNKWGPPGSRYATPVPSMQPQATCIPSQPQTGSVPTSSSPAQNSQPPSAPNTGCLASSAAPQAQQSGFLVYPPEKGTASARSQSRYRRFHPAGSQFLTRLPTGHEQDDPCPEFLPQGAKSDAHEDRTLVETDINAHSKEQPVGSTVTSKYELGNKMDYCCSYEPTGSGSKIYSYYAAAKEKGYKTVILTLWADHHRDIGTIGVSIAPLFPCQVVTPEDPDGAQTITFHGWDKAKNRDEAFKAANRLLYEVHSDCSLYRRLTRGTTARLIEQNITQLMMTLN